MRFECRNGVSFRILRIVKEVCSNKSEAIRRVTILNGSCYSAGILKAKLTFNCLGESALQVTENYYKHLVSIPG